MIGDTLYRLRWPLSVGLAVGLIGVYLLWWREPPAPLQVISPAPSVREYKVYVSGAVTRPGVYAFQDGERIENALAAAGGVTIEADLERLNLALRLHDEMHVRVPTVPTGVATASGGTAEVAYPLMDIINLNTATPDQLDSLPGVGPVTVGRILEHRQGQGPFQRIEELVELKIVSSSTFEKIKGRITAP